MRTDTSMMDAIESTYAAVLDPPRWSTVLTNLQRANNSQAATLWILDKTHQLRFPKFILSNLPVEPLRDYIDYYVSICPNAQYILTHPNERIVHDGLYLTESELDNHPYYVWQKQWTDVRYRMIGRLLVTPGIQSGVGLHREKLAGRFQSSDIRRFSMLFTHVERALTIAFQLGDLSSMINWTEALLNRCKIGLVLLNQSGLIVYANPQAESISNDKDGIHIDAHGLSFNRVSDQLKFDQCIAQASGRESELPREASVMRVDRPSELPPYVLSVIPIPGESSSLTWNRPWVSVSIHDSCAEMHFRVEQLASLLGLTQAEAKLTHLLASGLDLQEAADALNIQYSSARSRVSTILQKTNTRRQAELIRLVLGLNSSF